MHICKFPRSNKYYKYEYELIGTLYTYKN